MSKMEISSLSNYEKDISLEESGWKLKNGEAVLNENGEGYEKDLIIPEGVHTIGRYVFDEEDFDSVTFPSTLVTIEEGAFQECNIPEIIIPEGVQSIEDHAFCGCSAKKLVLPSTLKEIGKHAFSGITIKELTIPEGVAFIGEVAFASSKIEELTIPANVKYISTHAFAQSKISKLNIHEDCKAIIASEAFHSNQLREVVIPEGVMVLQGAFRENFIFKITFSREAGLVSNDAFQESIRGENDIQEAIVDGVSMAAVQTVHHVWLVKEDGWMQPLKGRFRCDTHQRAVKRIYDMDIPDLVTYEADYPLEHLVLRRLKEA